MVILENYNILAVFGKHDLILVEHKKKHTSFYPRFVKLVYYLEYCFLVKCNQQTI